MNTNTNFDQQSLVRFSNKELIMTKKSLEQLKHKASPGRRVTWIERRIGMIKKELNKRKMKKLRSHIRGSYGRATVRIEFPLTGWNGGDKT